MTILTEQAIAQLRKSISIVQQIVTERRLQKVSDSQFCAVARELREIEKYLSKLN